MDCIRFNLSCWICQPNKCLCSIRFPFNNILVQKSKALIVAQLESAVSEHNTRPFWIFKEIVDVAPEYINRQINSPYLMHSHVPCLLKQQAHL